jgi:hypothetical protein
MPFCSAHRTPRAGVDPIRDAATAMRVVELAMHHPPVAETVALLLDHERRGLGLVVVSGTFHGDDVLEVAECLSAVSVDVDRLGGLVLATVRPGGGAHADDGDRWLEMSDECDQAGMELVEWFLVGAHGVTCPRDLLGEPPRW